MTGAVLAAILLAAPAEAAPEPVEEPTEEPAAPLDPAPPAKTTVDEAPPPSPTTSATSPVVAPAAQQPSLPASASETRSPPRRDHPRREIAPALFRVDILVAGGTQWIPDPSYRAFDDGLNMPGPTVLVRADARLGRSDLFLGGGVGYRRLWTDAVVLGEATTRLVVQDLMIFGRFSWSPLEGIDPFLELGTGPSFVDVHLRSGVNSHQRDVLALFDSLAGIALSLPRKWHPSNHVTAGVEVGLGYTLRSEFDVIPEPVVENDVIATGSTSFGDLRLHGLLWRAGLFLRFM